MLEWRAVCAERCTCGSGRRSREIVRLRPASYSTSHGQRLCVCRGHHGLVHPQGAGLAGIEHDGCGLLCALEEAISHYGTPDIFNTGQGAQFTSDAFTDVLKAAGIQISMDGKGRWVDNVFVERLWRGPKYEEVYLKAYETVAEARLGIENYFQF